MMGVDEKLVKVDELKGVDGKETLNGEVGLDLERELEGCRNKCRELEERSEKDGERRMLLELEIEKRRDEFELLGMKFRELEVLKVGVEDELKVLKKRNFKLDERINQVEKEDGVVCEEVVELKIENNVLECEKRSAEREAEVWKLKCKELELRVLELEKENLVLKSGKGQMAGMAEMQTTKASNLEVKKISEHMDTEDGVVNSSPVKGTGDLHTAGSPFTDLPSKQFVHANGGRRCLVSETEKNHHNGVRKQLEFGEGGSLNMKMAPSTPAVARPSSFGIIDISDSEDEVANISVNTPFDVNRTMAHVSIDFPPGDTMGDGDKKTSDGNFKRILSYQSDEEDMKDYKGSFPSISTPKRKRATNIVTTDSESDSDDNIPIRKLKTKHLSESNCDSVDSHLNTFPVNATLSEEKNRESATPRRRLVALRECSAKNESEEKSRSNSNTGGANYNSGIATNGCVENDEVEEDEDEWESDTEGENLGGFIVSSSDISESTDGSNESEDVSDDIVDFNEVLSKIRRSRGHKVEWEFEADMLAAFGKDPELCMKAVCALYRKQTADEKIDKFTYYSNREGFSQCDALRGSTLAEFLTDGDPQGDVKKSVEELREYDPKAPELCRTLATHYSKQLFAIYKSKEDPLFLPS